MSLSPVKRVILETMWMLDKPARAVEIAKQVGLGFPSVMMHIIGLTRMGHVEAPEKGYYVITQSGRRVLGFPQINKEKASDILAYLPVERSFHFYADVGKPLNVYAASLRNFCDEILNVDVDSVEFHVKRGDFQAWFMGLGDVELARKTIFIEEREASGEELRKKLYEIVKNRCEELARIRQRQLHSTSSMHL